jgi:hypothetical protein
MILGLAAYTAMPVAPSKIGSSASAGSRWIRSDRSRETCRVREVVAVGVCVVAIAATGNALLSAFRHGRVPLNYTEVERSRWPKLFVILVALAALGFVSGIFGLMQALYEAT